MRSLDVGCKREIRTEKCPSAIAMRIKASTGSRLSYFDLGANVNTSGAQSRCKRNGQNTNNSSWETSTWLTKDELLAEYSPEVVDDILKHMSAFLDPWRPNPDASDSLIAVQYKLKCEGSEQTTKSDNKSRGVSFRTDVEQAEGKNMIPAIIGGGAGGGAGNGAGGGAQESAGGGDGRGAVGGAGGGAGAGSGGGAGAQEVAGSGNGGRAELTPEEIKYAEKARDKAEQQRLKVIADRQKKI